AILDLQGFSACYQGRNDFLADVAHQNGYRGGHATFAGRTIGCPNQGVYRALDVGVGHDNHVIFSTAQGLYTLAKMCAAFVDVLCNGSRTDKADGRYVWVLEQGINNGFVALDHVEYAI